MSDCFQTELLLFFSDYLINAFNSSSYAYAFAGVFAISIKNSTYEINISIFSLYDFYAILKNNEYYALM